MERKGIKEYCIKETLGRHSKTPDATVSLSMTLLTNRLVNKIPRGKVKHQKTQHIYFVQPRRYKFYIKNTNTLKTMG